MRQSSESVAALASALAKAQAQLTNPEKSLTATISSGRVGEAARTFRYSPLSSGLDIVRKALGEHEIATVQTTAIDQASGMLNLTTMLAHASGEWIASDWPICPIAEIATPHRMGAALTYARRYALFTLVGIAGEDDLDAPDLQVKPNGSPVRQNPPAARRDDLPPSRKYGNGAREHFARNRPAVLKDELSASLRDALIAQISLLNDQEEAATWASGVLARKNSLTAADANLLEVAFEQKLVEFSAPAAEQQDTGPTGIAPEAATPKEPQAARKKPRAGRSQRIDKSVLTFPAAKRKRNKEHLHHIAQQPCVICGRKPSDPHHLRFTQPRALGRKVSDEFTVPLCRMHHREAHRAGDERAWWRASGIDPLNVARKLWKDTQRPPNRLPGEGTALQASQPAAPAKSR
jgi:ERF superfamily